MTTETLTAHIKAYRASTLGMKDYADMVNELVSRFEGLELSKANLRERIERWLEAELGNDDE
jgi:serine/threonine-protein kinase RIO1